MATGGIYVFKPLPDGKPAREVPDSFHLLAEYAKGHSLVLSSSMANDEHIPGTIRGHAGTIVMVDHGQFERNVPYITVKPQVRRAMVPNSQPRTFKNMAIGGGEYEKKIRTKENQIPIEQKDMMTAHLDNFLSGLPAPDETHPPRLTGHKAG